MSRTPTFRAYKSQDGNDYIVDAGGRLVVKAGGGVLLDGFYERLDVSILAGRELGSPPPLLQQMVCDANSSQGVMGMCFTNPDSAENEGAYGYLHCSGGMPHGYKLGSPILPVMWWVPFDDDPPAYGDPEASPPVSDDTDQVHSWELEIYFAYPGATPGGSPGWPASESKVWSVIDQSLIGKTRNMVYATAFNSAPQPYTDALGASFSLRLSRVPVTEGESFDAQIMVVGLGLYYPVDAPGSLALDSKF